MNADSDSTKSGAAASPAPTILDNPNAPEIAAEAAFGFVHSMGVAKINFAGARYNLTGTQPTFVITGRVVMPLEAFTKLYRGLNEILTKWEAQGLINSDWRKAE